MALNNADEKFKEIEVDQPMSGTTASSQMPNRPTRVGCLVSLDELNRRGFRRLDIEFVGDIQQLASGPCRNWNSIGQVPDSEGLYAFVLEKNEESRVAYVGRTAHLWMVTKGSLPGVHARPGQRYGRPKYAGVTRERINALVLQATDAGYTVSHWVCPRGEGATALDLAERALIAEWDLVACGWNRR